MNNGTSDSAPSAAASRSSANHNTSGVDELSQTKRQLLQAEVRLARARATAAAAEIDVKVLTARLRSLVR